MNYPRTLGTALVLASIAGSVYADSHDKPDWYELHQLGLETFVVQIFNDTRMISCDGRNTVHIASTYENFIGKVDGCDSRVIVAPNSQTFAQYFLDGQGNPITISIGTSGESTNSSWDSLSDIVAARAQLESFLNTGDNLRLLGGTDWESSGEPSISSLISSSGEPSNISSVTNPLERWGLTEGNAVEPCIPTLANPCAFVKITATLQDENDWRAILSEPSGQDATDYYKAVRDAIPGALNITAADKNAIAYDFAVRQLFLEELAIGQ